MPSTNSPSEPDKIRLKVLEILDNSSHALANSLNLSAGQNPRDSARSELVDWAVKVVEKARSGLDFFWSHMDLYSTARCPEYINIVSYQFTVDNIGASI